MEQLSRELADRGHSVDVVHCVDSFRLLQRKQPEAEPHAHAGVTVHRISSPLGRLSPIATHRNVGPDARARLGRSFLTAGFKQSFCRHGPAIGRRCSSLWRWPFSLVWSRFSANAHPATPLPALFPIFSGSTKVSVPLGTSQAAHKGRLEVEVAAGIAAQSLLNVCNH